MAKRNPLNEEMSVSQDHQVDIQKMTHAAAMSQGKFQVQNVVKDIFGLDVPIETVPLPSRGVIYSPDSPLYGCETLQIRSMTARDEDILMSRAYIKNGTVIQELIKSCLIDKTIDPDEMIAGDRSALMIALRITGYGAEYNVSCSCPKCNKDSEQSFNLAQLGIKRLQIEPVADGSNLFEIELPVSKKIVKVKFANGYDEKEMSVSQEKKKKLGIQQDTLVTDKLQNAIVAVQSITDKTKIGMFIKDMPVRDSLALRKFLEENEPGIDMNVSMKCKHCFEESEVKIPIEVSFFWPDR
jgi:hypothetical protein